MSDRRTLFEIDVFPDGAEPYRVEADSRDVSMWERSIPGRSLGMVQGSGVKMGYLEEIAHISARRKGLFEGNLSKFQTECAIVPIQGDDSGLDPTQPAA